MIYLIRLGAFGQIGKFYSQKDLRPTYGQQLVCQTSRGLEVGEYLETLEAPFDSRAELEESIDGDLIRALTPQDQLMIARLNQDKLAAIEECQELIDRLGLPVAILDAELTFDGKHLYFYFSGDADDRLDRITETLAETFDARVGFSEFAELMTKGCGPECGEGEGCGVGGCSSCGLQGSCSTTKSTKDTKINR